MPLEKKKRNRSDPIKFNDVHFSLYFFQSSSDQKNGRKRKEEREKSREKERKKQRKKKKQKEK